MRHAKKVLKIGRTTSHRKATLQAMSAALIEHKRITTTLGKARALRQFVEPILNRAKDDSTHSRRMAFKALQSKEAVKTLYGEVAEAIGDRPGGYTRIVKLGQRGGDASEMAIVELVDYNDVKPSGSSGRRRKTRRSRRSSGGTSAQASAPKAAPAAAPTAPVEAAPAEAPAEEVAVETPAVEAPESQEAEAVASDAADPDATGNPQVPTTEDAGLHGDTEQGAPPRTGEPIPDAQPTTQGRSGEHRG